jgi:formylglycine-generating enzyme
VEQVSWYDAQEFLLKLNTHQLPAGCGYRLPSETEWEYAARGGQQSKGYEYAGGNDLDKVGWYRDNSHSETKVVGLKLPNELGLFDLSGNVDEWCEDQWHSNLDGAPQDGSAWVDKEQGVHRVFRGGGWFDDSEHCRSTFRYRPSFRDSDVGFRVVCFFPPGSWPAHSK